MKLIDLDQHAANQLGWKRLDMGTYMDRDGFNEVNVVAVEDDMSSEVVATVLFAGTPVLTLRSNDWEVDASSDFYESDESGSGAQAYAAFLVALGVVDEEAPAYVAECGMASLWEDSDLILDGQGHLMTEFVGTVARAVHAAYPDTTEEPTGF